MIKKILILLMVCGIWMTNSIANPINDQYCETNQLPDGYYAHPADCQFYYRCFDRNTELYQCMPGLAYDIINKSCVFIASARNGAPPCHYGQ